MPKILLTGGSGFIAAHCLEQLLEQGHTVITTVRSEEKAQKIRDAYKSQAQEGRLEVVIVPDLAKEDAFDEVAKTPGLEGVLHTASPFHFNWTDPQKELIEPALNGTLSILRALHRSAPTVRRIVITSSFAAVLNETHFQDPTATFSESTWNPDGIDALHRSPVTAYRVSKTLAERSAWRFIDEEKPTFDLVTVNPPLVLGPVVHHLNTLDAINTSNTMPVNVLKGKFKEEIPQSGNVPLWVDVRDVARAHVRALEKKEAGGHRLFTTAGVFGPREIAEAVRKQYPEYEHKLPAPEVKGGERPDANKMFQWDSSETNKILGIEWISLEKSIGDFVKSLKEANIQV